MTSFPDARISKTVVNSDIVVDLNNPSTSLTITEKFPDPLYDLLSPDDRRTLDEGVGIGFKSKSGTWLKKGKDGELSHSTEVYIFSWYDISKETISTEKQEKETIVGKPHSNSLGTVLKKRFCNRNQYNALSPNLQDMLLPPGVDLLDAQFVSLVANGTTFDKLEIHFNYKGPLSSNQYCLVSGKAGKIDWIPWPRVANHNHIWMVHFFDLCTERDFVDKKVNKNKRGYCFPNMILVLNSVVNNQNNYVNIGKNINSGTGTQTIGTVRYNSLQANPISAYSSNQFYYICVSQLVGVLVLCMTFVQTFYAIRSW